MASIRRRSPRPQPIPHASQTNYRAHLSKSIGLLRSRTSAVPGQRSMRGNQRGRSLRGCAPVPRLAGMLKDPIPRRDVSQRLLSLKRRRPPSPGKTGRLQTRTLMCSRRYGMPEATESSPEWPSLPDGKRPVDTDIRGTPTITIWITCFDATKASAGGCRVPLGRLWAQLS